ncbi:MAG: hypothetical protein FH748_13050 [Balneolaceae bacterium]|nr:hypothetical protein [Balneolaceae bacterium]
MKEFTHKNPRDLGDIITDTFAYIRLHYKSLGKGLIYFVLPLFLVSSLLVGNAYSDLFDFTINNPNDIPNNILGADFWGGLLLTLFATVTIFTITLKHIELSQYNTEIEAMDLTEDFGRNFINLFLMYIVVLVSVFVSMFFFIIPGIYIGVKFFLGPAAAIIEDKNPIDGLSRSWNLTQDNWWISFGTYIVLYIITTMMSYVLVIPFSIIIGLFAATGAESSAGLSSTIGIFYGLMIVISSLFSVIMIIGMALHYFNLVERKEGSGLRAQIEELG